MSLEVEDLILDRMALDEVGRNSRKAEIGDRRSEASLGMTKHLRQEAEAHRFAIEPLAPHARFDPHTNADPNLSALVELARLLKFSKEACARRYRATLIK